MARIIGGIGTSHVPTIAMAFDKGKQGDPDWQPLFRGYEPVAKWLAEKKPDVGRFAITKKEEDRYVFRVPMLRNVAKTAPYFHDGSVERLDRAVRVMATLQLGRTLDDAAVAEIVSFLETLTGDVPANYAPPGKRPEL